MNENKIVAYKLLSQNMSSYNNTEWEIGGTITLPDTGNYRMCSEKVLHCYSDKYLAVLMNPAHASIDDPRLFEILVDRVVNTDGLKQASLSQTIVKEIELPIITNVQKVAFAIYCALQVYNDPTFISWAYRWLSGENRTAYAAATYATYANAATTYVAAAHAATHATYAAATHATYANVAAAHAIATYANATYVAAIATYVASAANAAVYVRETKEKINFGEVWKKAAEIK